MWTLPHKGEVTRLQVILAAHQALVDQDPIQEVGTGAHIVISHQLKGECRTTLMIWKLRSQQFPSLRKNT